MVVKIVSPKLKFNLKFSGKFNFLIGDSGTKKTLFNLLMAASTKNSKHIKVSIFSNNYPLNDCKIHSLINTSGKEDLDIFTRYSGDLFIIDEFSSIFSEKDLPKYILNSNNYFIFITREVIGWLPVSIDSIYRLEINNGLVKNIPYYCDSNIELTNIRYGIKSILTEDSEGSRLFFKHFFHNLDICSRSEDINGKKCDRDNATLHLFLEKWIDNGKNDILVVFDASAYGFYYPMLKDVINKNKNIRISILSWESYEWYLLSCSPINKTYYKSDIGYSFNSLEQFCEIELKNCIEYRKDRLPKCVTGCTTCNYLSCMYRNKDFLFIQNPLTKIECKLNLF